MAGNHEAPLAYSISEVAKHLSCSRDTVERLIAAGRIATVRLSPRRVVISRSELVRFLADESGSTAA